MRIRELTNKKQQSKIASAFLAATPSPTLADLSALIVFMEQKKRQPLPNVGAHESAPKDEGEWTVVKGKNRLWKGHGKSHKLLCSMLPDSQVQAPLSVLCLDWQNNVISAICGSQRQKVS
ncbi:unnamed protein product [Protopolystoma xenopodis]|uniref:Uncharacterized protein n=1 Tax=Protopolystoma xenopodis TaxID=117903 RepID=A0A3S5CHT4_9PLAT|nr:unnamed protein product [Protopolystoma xenopodis]